VTGVTVVSAGYVAELYQQTRERIVALISEAGDAAWTTPVPACPGWSVRNVVAHQAAVADDWVAERLSIPPTDDDTAGQVRRFRDHDVSELLAAWASAATQLKRRADTSGVTPPLGDITVHEHDIRSALGRPGARDSAAVRYSSDQLLRALSTPVPLTVTVENAEFRSGPDEGAALRLRTTRFEALRWRTGRRSPAQLAAMDWSDDPTPVLEHLYMFGPASADVVE
jgi:uncharacterized protein (TIGR03083 family)